MGSHRRASRRPLYLCHCLFFWGPSDAYSFNEETVFFGWFKALFDFMRTFWTQHALILRTSLFDNHVGTINLSAFLIVGGLQRSMRMTFLGGCSCRGDYLPNSLKTVVLFIITKGFPFALRWNSFYIKKTGEYAFKWLLATTLNTQQIYINRKYNKHVKKIRKFHLWITDAIHVIINSTCNMCGLSSLESSIESRIMWSY